LFERRSWPSALCETAADRSEDRGLNRRPPEIARRVERGEIEAVPLEWRRQPNIPVAGIAADKCLDQQGADRGVHDAVTREPSGVHEITDVPVESNQRYRVGGHSVVPTGS